MPSLFRLSMSVVTLFAFSVVLASCGNSKAFVPKKKKKAKISHYEIYQPDSTYKDDDVVIWQKADRDKRAFLLSPGTKVKLLQSKDTADGNIMYEIETADERKGWVPKKWCKAVYKK
ncbi:MAG: hypothetical protein ACYTFG_22585 [Planctomycetota bacterium]